MDFKKSLAFTTALSAVALLSAQAAVAAEKPKLKIYGYQETFFGIADVDDGTASSGTPTYSGGIPEGAFNIGQYGEIRFKATGTTDSGMNWEVYFEDVQNEADSTAGKLSTDEANVALEGSWGRLEIGGQDGAADKMRVTGTEVDLLGSNILGFVVQNRAASGLRGSDMDNVLDSSDDSKFTYYTPRVSGFQAGLSWVPSAGTKGTEASGEKEGELEAGLSYKGKAGDAKFELTAAYADNGDNDNADQKGWLVGGQVGFGAFTVAAGYSSNDNWRTADTEQTAWSVGAAYNAGKWEVSVLHVESQLEFGANSGFSGSADDEYTQSQIQAAYNLGGGLTAGVGYYVFELDSDNGTGGGGTRGPNDGSAVIGKLNARF